MDITTKKLMTAARGLIGRHGKAFPTAREIRTATGDRGSSLRAGLALKALQVERGMLPHLRGGLPPDFLAELAEPPTTVAPVWDDVAGLPTLAIDLLKQAIVVAGAEREREWAEILRARREESERWKADTAQLDTQVQDVAKELDEERRTAAEAQTAHTAAMSALREEIGVLRKEVEFAHREVARVTDSSQRLQQELDAARDAWRTETERCRLAETRVASLEATLTGQTTEIAALKASLATRGNQADNRRPRKTASPV